MTSTALAQPSRADEPQALSRKPAARARPSFVCHSNGQAGSYERFHLYNRELDKAMGGDTALDACLASIPK